MTSKNDTPKNAPEALAELLAAFETFSKAMHQTSTQTQDIMGQIIPGAADEAQTSRSDTLGLAADFADVFGKIAANPEQILKAQSALWQGYSTLWANAVKQAGGEDAPEDAVKPRPGDRRWQAPQWSENLVFDLIKQSYLLSSNWLNELVANTENVDSKTRKKVAFFTRQLTDAFAPTNFALTNPEVLHATMQSKGDNLKRGMENLTRDIESGDGILKISQTDTNAYVLGRDLATAPGKVIFENDIMQLLQFAPSTRTAYRRPLLIFPPWINKYYILDLRPEHSMVRWLTGKGYCVFLVSWVNPDTRLKDKNFEDYMREGVFAALDAIKEATGEEKVNAVGYCIGGTLLAATLAYMKATKDRRIASATFFATLTDFEEAGDLSIFCDDAGLAEIERRMDEAGGVLEGAAMAEVFNMLRANDMIWSNVISSYLLGNAPRAFELLFWNADCTRMPKALHLYYLHNFYRQNAFAKGQMRLGGMQLDPQHITIALYVQACRADHIAPCSSVYRGARLYGSASKGGVRFMLSGSGHIAGVVNPPAAKKYQHWTNDALPTTLEEWLQEASEHPGSWWPDWHQWLKVRSGKKIPARTPGDGRLGPLEDAPGRYVQVKS